VLTLIVSGVVAYVMMALKAGQSKTHVMQLEAKAELLATQTQAKEQVMGHIVEIKQAFAVHVAQDELVQKTTVLALDRIEKKLDRVNHA